MELISGRMQDQKHMRWIGLRLLSLSLGEKTITTDHQNFPYICTYSTDCIGRQYNLAQNIFRIVDALGIDKKKTPFYTSYPHSESVTEMGSLSVVTTIQH